MGYVSLPATLSGQAQLAAASYFALLLIASLIENSFGQPPQSSATEPTVRVRVSTSLAEQQQWQHRSNRNSIVANNNNAQQQQSQANLRRVSQALTATTRLQRSSETIAANNQQPNGLTVIQPRPEPSPHQAVQFKPQDALKVQNYNPIASNNGPNPSSAGLQRRSNQLLMPGDLNIQGRIWEHPGYSQPISTWWNISTSALQAPAVPATKLANATVAQQPIREQPPPQVQQAQQQPPLQQQPNLIAGQAFENNARDWSGASLFFTRKQLKSNELDHKCKRRGFVRLLKSNLVLGSSLLAAAIPLAVYVFPDSFRWGKGIDPLNEASSSSNLIAAGPRFNLQGRVDSMMGWIERSVEHLPNFPRLHPKECVKRSICEAHNEPDKYGAIGFMLRLFFPATNLSSTDRMDNMEYKVINKYRHAAGYGLARRMESANTTEGGMLPSSSGACREKYEDCLVSLLDVAQNLLDTFFT